jgi:hypothetical protein
LNLVLGFAWLIAAVAAFLWPHINPQAHVPVIIGTKISAAWLLLAFAVYDFARWWTLRSRQATQKAIQENLERQEREHRNEPPRDPDPTFDFTRKDSPEQRSS